MKQIAFGSLSVALFAVAAQATPQAGNRGAGTTLAPAPSARQEISTVALAGISSGTRSVQFTRNGVVSNVMTIAIR